MFRYRVTEEVKDAIEEFFGRNLFYLDNDGEFYIDQEAIKTYTYRESLPDGDHIFNTGTLDDACQSLYSTDFAAQSTQVLKPQDISTVSLTTTTPLGVPKVAVIKPDGTSKTYISHNFCDNTTWPATNDSVWVFGPSAGKRMIIMKAEVQFSHDVALGSQTPAGEMYFDIFAGGVKIPSESRVFASIGDVFSLGNAHYTMSEAVDDIPTGITTVVFDYADSITLESDVAMEIRISTKNNVPMGGTFCTVSLVANEVDA